MVATSRSRSGAVGVVAMQCDHSGEPGVNPAKVHIGAIGSVATFGFCAVEHPVTGMIVARSRTEAIRRMRKPFRRTITWFLCELRKDIIGSKTWEWCPGTAAGIKAGSL